MTLTPAERQYLRRFLYESLYQLNYRDAATRPPYYADLRYLAAALIENRDDGDLVADVCSGHPDPSKTADNYPPTPFPWESPQALHQLARAVAGEHYGMAVVDHVDNVLEFLTREYPELSLVWQYPLPPAAHLAKATATIAGYLPARADPVVMVKFVAQ